MNQLKELEKDKLEYEHRLFQHLIKSTNKAPLFPWFSRKLVKDSGKPELLKFKNK